MPLLAKRFQVIAMDLPGHGFTESGGARQSSLPGMAAGVTALLRHLEIAPAVGVGHSAGAAIVARMCLDGGISPRSLVSLNGALLPLRGLAGQLFAPAAKLLSMFPQVPHLFSWQAADRRMVARLVKETGSTPPAQMIDLYHQLVRSPRHVAGTLRMMANWDLPQLEKNLHRLEPPLYLLVCEDGSPGFVDFQLGWFSPGRGRWFRRLAYEDLRHLLKHKRTYCPENLTRRELAILANPSLLSRINRRTIKPLYLFVTRRLLGWSDREGAGDRGARL